MEDHSNRDKILSLLAEKAKIKQSVNEQAVLGFGLVRDKLKSLTDELRPRVAKIHKSIPVEYSLKGDSEVEFSLAGDTIVFLLHTNVFTFDPSHEIWKLSYVKEDVSRAFCGQIYIYNFLSESLKYFRGNDTGYLVARIFINKEGHYFVEGKRQLGFLYNDFANSVFDAAQAQRVAESTILYCLDFDPFTPPYDQVGVVSVQDVLESTLHSKIATGKRLGFKFQADTDMF